MNLLGSYQSNLIPLHKQELLTLLQSAIAAGDYGGGKLLDPKAAALLAQQASDFTSLPGIQAGSRASAQSILYPLQLLAARYQAIGKEREDFLGRMDALLSVLEKDSSLIDQLVAAAQMETWVSRRGGLSGAFRFYQDFAATHGAVSVTIPQTDPETGALFPRNVSDVGFMLAPVPGLEAEPLRFGIAPPSAVRTFAPSQLTWTFESKGETEVLDGPGWSTLSLLEDSPRLRYGDPALSVVDPAGERIDDTLAVSGSSVFGNVPVFVRVFCQPRPVSRQVVTGGAGVAVPLTNYRILGDDFIVLDQVRSYDQGLDYTVDATGRLVPLSAAADKTLTVLFTEMFPAYQCSVNQTDWSQTVLFDPDRPEAPRVYPQGNRFPVLDESNVETGLFLELLRIPRTDYMCRIDTPVSAGNGAEATLEIDLNLASYMNGLHLAPLVNLPMRLKNLTAEGLMTGNTVLFDGDLIVDRPLTIRFDRQLVRKLFLRFSQENYAFKEHVLDPADQLRRETLVALQASLSFATRRIHITPARRVEGVQYDFGLNELRGEDWSVTMPRDRGVFVAGPFDVTGTPELIRLDAEYSGDVKFYLLDSPFDPSDILTGSSMLAGHPHGVELLPGQGFSYTPPSSVPSLTHCQFHVKFVLRDAYAVVERFLLEVTGV